VKGLVNKEYLDDHLRNPREIEPRDGQQVVKKGDGVG